jgi:DmsE family decaheme c-type cytochrome
MRNEPKGWLPAVTLCCVVTALVYGQQPAAQPAKEAPAAAAEPVAAAEYIGSEACQACHEEIATAFGKNPHTAIETAKKYGRIGQGCESCHGPGSKHAESVSPDDIRNPAKLRPGQSDQTCFACHRNQRTHSGRVSTGHAKGQVTCNQCHSIHKTPTELVARKPADVNQQCSSCHTDSAAQFNRPHAHRLPQGAMSCVDCHNPHSSLITARQSRGVAINEPGCLRCHLDKRGPFTYEHAPMRLDSCTACHEPHGSANPRMLTRHEVRYVCLECHANIGTGNTSGSGNVLGGVPPSFHDLRTQRFRNCTICHQKVHGSHVDRNLLR